MASPFDHHCWLQRLPNLSMMRSLKLYGIWEKISQQGGHSRHGPRGTTLYILLQRLEAAGVPYTLDARPGRGYVVTVQSPEERGI